MTQGTESEPFDFTDANQRRLAERVLGELGLAFILDVADLVKAIRKRGFGEVTIVEIKNKTFLKISDSRRPKGDWREWLDNDESI